MMTSEHRLDRLERIAMLMVRAGARVRREQNEKINIIIDSQIRTEERFARNEERVARNEKRVARNEERVARNEARFATLADDLARSHNELAKSLKELAKAQTRTENRLDSLIEIIKQDRNGNPG